MKAGHEPDVGLVKDRSPLHGSAVQHLAHPAMTDLGIDRVGTDFVVHRVAVATSGILREEALVVGRPIAPAKRQ